MESETSDPGEIVKVAIVDDHFFFRQGIRDVLNSQPGITVVGESSDGEEALEMIAETRPDVVLMDVNLPTINGQQVTQQIKNDHPDVAVVILTAYDDEEQIYRAIRIGASAYFAKDVAPAQLVETVRLVAQGYTLIANKCYVQRGRSVAV